VAVRRLLAAVLVPLAIVLPAVAAWSTWGYGQATDQGAFARAARDLADDAAVRAAVGDRIATVADDRLAGVGLPGQHARVQAVVDALGDTAAYRAALRALLVDAHGQFADRLAGDSDAPVTLDLAAPAAPVRERLAAAGLTPVAAALRDPGTVVIATGSQVRRARAGVEAAHLLRAVTLPASVLALVGVLLVARRRSTGLLLAALCLAGAVAVGALAWVIVRAALDDDVAVAVFDVLSRPLAWWAIGAGAAAAGLAAAGAVLAVTRRRAARPEWHPWSTLPRP
jgi:hypothetical protein